MSNAVLIIGETGAGKSTAIRTLDPAETFIISVLDKPLPFQGYKQQYKRHVRGGERGNYFSTDNSAHILAAIAHVNNERPEIKNLVIDDTQYIMGNEFMGKALVKGYDKFSEIGQNMWRIIREGISTRDDLFVFFLSHSDTDVSGKVKFKTIGKMLDDKIVIEGMFSIVLHALTSQGTYKFLTQNDGTHVAKSPQGMFPHQYIDNDLALVKQCMSNYFGELLAEDINL